VFFLRPTLMTKMDS